jgi:transposase
MSLGEGVKQPGLFEAQRLYCQTHLPEGSIYRLLAERGHQLFPDTMFADLFATTGRRSIPPSIVAAVMVLQRLEGLSDREATERFSFDIRFRYAAGARFDTPAFVHTVLVDMRERLRTSDAPNRIFERVLELAKEVGLVGRRRRVLDSTALYDAVATQDTVTLIRSAIRGLLHAARGDEAFAVELRGALRRDDDYASAGKPACDWDDEKARTELVDALARDAYALLARLDGRRLEPAVDQAAKLLATVTGQDLEQTEDGLFCIARRVAKDRVISTVDPDARHGHKTNARGFDGYKGHVAIDPDTEIITATEVTAGNVGDAQPAAELLADVLTPAPAADANTGAEPTPAPPAEPTEVYADASYGGADLLEKIERGGAVAEVKVQAPSAPAGHFGQDKFRIDLDTRTVTCPQGILVQLRLKKDGGGEAKFGASCKDCQLRAQCTDSPSGRVVNVNAKHALLDRHRKRCAQPDVKQRYRAIRPKVERKIAHLMRRKHGGRRARVRGRERVHLDFALLAAGVNLARIARRALPNVQAAA